MSENSNGAVTTPGAASFLQKVAEARKAGGLPAVIARAPAWLYRHLLRPLLPMTADPILYGGIAVGRRRWLDQIVPGHWVPQECRDYPGYEETLRKSLAQTVLENDRVVIVGGGSGVTLVTAARLVGPFGSVHCFEGAAESVAMIHRTLAMNGITSGVVVQHAVVARAIQVYGTEPNEPVVLTGDLPECDVLELDCEGAEADILRDLMIRPRALLVETHGFYGAPTSLTLSLLEGKGYRCRVLGFAEPNDPDFCERNDVRIVEATSKKA